MALKSLFHLTVMLWLFQMGLSTQADSYPLGVALGLSQISAARFNNMGEPHEIVRISGNPAYQAYMVDTLEHEGKRKQLQGEWYIQDGDSLVSAPPDTHDKEQAQIIFTEALNSLRQAVKKSLDDEHFTIGAVSAPQHFNSSSRHAVMLALQHVEPDLRQLHQVVVGCHATRLAYGLDSCDGFSFDESSRQKCDLKDGSLYVLIVELEQHHLQLFLLDVDADTVGILDRSRFSELGVGGEEGRTLDFRGEMDGAPWDHIQDKLRAFMRKNDVGPKQKQQDLLQAVIISGEASDAPIGHLRLLIKELLHDQGKDGILRDTVHPAFVSAVGAAYQSMLWQQSPHLLDDVLDTNFGHPPDYVHDEL